jgi:cell division protein FtsB
MPKQYSTVTSKLDYRKMARKYAEESINLQKKLKAANERIHNLERENKDLKENQQHPYMAKA